MWTKKWGKFLNSDGNNAITASEVTLIGLLAPYNKANFLDSTSRNTTENAEFIARTAIFLKILLSIGPNPTPMSEYLHLFKYNDLNSEKCLMKALTFQNNFRLEGSPRYPPPQNITGTWFWIICLRVIFFMPLYFIASFPTESE